MNQPAVQRPTHNRPPGGKTGKHAQKTATILFAALVLFLATLQSGQPALADGNVLDTAKVDSLLLSAMRQNTKGTFRVIVQTEAPRAKAVTPGNAVGNQELRNTDRAHKALDQSRQEGGQHGNSLAIIGGAVSTLSYQAIVRLSHNPAISRISLDQKFHPLGSPSAALGSLYTQIVGAPDVWAQGDSGQGITVAVLDSGIAAVDDLALPSSRIVASVDFTGTPSGNGDPGGHGTHVAGIVGGNGTDSQQARQGIAPNVNLVSVRVIDGNGNATLSGLLAGIQWVVTNRKTYHIKIMNMSLGAPSTQSYRDDMLASATELAWQSGIVVVVAAGNAGPLPGTVASPGIDPYVITVGALDDNGTLNTSDDTVAHFSSQGPTPDGLSKPDVVAPGRKIVSLRVPGSFLDLMLPDRVTNGAYFRLSGTSMAAPVVAGTAALMLQKRPGLSPDQIKYILKQTAHPVAAALNSNVAGAGLIDAYASANSTLSYRANRGLTPSDAFCQAVYTTLKGMSLGGIWRDPYYKGINWANITWDNITWDRTTWENITWDNITWDNITWDNITWDNITWDSATWDSTAGWDSAPID
jgi:serine protease AprX